MTLVGLHESTPRDPWACDERVTLIRMGLLRGTSGQNPLWDFRVILLVPQRESSGQNALWDFGLILLGPLRGTSGQNPLWDSGLILSGHLRGTSGQNPLCNRRKSS